MSTAVCTLFEGNYHFGLAALVNSLCLRGFQGVVWVGYKGDLPEWTGKAQDENGYREFTATEDVSIRFIRQQTSKHLNNCKPTFMQQVFQMDTDIEALFYFDPDIIVKCPWNFIEEWAKQGVTLCQDINHCLPANHPTRLIWKKFAAENGHNASRASDVFYNGGFVGLTRQHMSFLTIWEELMCALCDHGIDLSMFRFADAHYPNVVFDQDLMNVAAMITEHPLSTVGPQEMDFIPGGTIMSHATGSPKPWKKRMTLQALKGYPPSNADKGYWQHTQTPINLYSPLQRAVKKIDLRVGAAVGRVMSRS
jgi:hypothetical protein